MRCVRDRSGRRAPRPAALSTRLTAQREVPRGRARASRDAKIAHLDRLSHVASLAGRQAARSRAASVAARRRRSDEKDGARPVVCTGCETVSGRIEAPARRSGCASAPDPTGGDRRPRNREARALPPWRPGRRQNGREGRCASSVAYGMSTIDLAALPPLHAGVLCHARRSVSGDCDGCR